MSKTSKICEIYCVCVGTGLMKQNPKKGMRWHPKSIPRNVAVVQGQGRRRRRVRRWYPGTQALREIRHYQRTTELCIPRAPFLW